MVRKDEEYNGYFIPKGTIVFCNSWAIMHDPGVFENPMEFRPERYLKDGQLDPESAAFGYGRSASLPLFDVKATKDGNGKPIPLEFDTGEELICKVKPFKVKITPLSSEHAALISRY
ncbi:cytochrome P450-like protein [Coprinopsis sp. MPI-PUGE-AT-0042]|nr:cytochrome P450-like protein [Coprinopsis sp. MPI-PUGE-AT-0042]